MTLKSLLPALWSEDVKRADPFASLHKEIDRVFDDFRHEPLWPSVKDEKTVLAPRIDVSETDDEIKISAELPGAEQEDVHVELADDILTISGEKKSEEKKEKEEEGRKFHRIERSYGSFQRSLRVPSGIDASKIEAAFKDGVLTVTVSKPPELKEKTRKIEVKAA